MSHSLLSYQNRNWHISILNSNQIKVYFLDVTILADGSNGFQFLLYLVSYILFHIKNCARESQSSHVSYIWCSIIFSVRFCLQILHVTHTIHNCLYLVFFLVVFSFIGHVSKFQLHT